MSAVIYQKQINSLAELESAAQELVPHFKFPSIVLFEGPLGAGKTTLIRALVQALGAKGDLDVASPTFALHHSYETARGPVEHWDLYRLESEDELESSGFWDQFADLQSLIFVEWSERLQRKWLPKTIPIFNLRITVSGPQRLVVLS